MTEYKPTNQLRFVRRKINDDDNFTVKVLQQLWEAMDSEVIYGTNNISINFVEEWRDVECVSEET